MSSSDQARFGYALTGVGDLDRDGYNGTKLPPSVCVCVRLFNFCLLILFIYVVLGYTHTHTHLTALCPGLPR